MSKADAVEEAVELVLADVVLEVVRERSAAHGEDDEVGEGEDEHRDPRAGFEERGEVAAGVGFLARVGLDALAGGEERDDEAGDTNGGPEGHGDLPTLGFVSLAELGDQGEGEAADDQLSDHGGDEAEGGEAGALVDIAGH